MPNTSWEVVNREIQRPLGFEAFSTTTNIVVGNKVVSTELANRWNQDDSFNGWFVIIRGTNNDEVVRRVTDYTGSTGQLTVAGSALNAESGSKTCEVSQFHPDDVKRAYNRARQDIFPRIAAHKDHRGIVTDANTLVYPVPTAIRRVDRVYLGRALLADHADNLFTDGGFENWTNATTPTNWILLGANSTVTQEEATSGPRNHMVLTGSNSAQLLVKTNDTTLLETLAPSVATRGVYVVMAMYVYCRTANAIRCQIDSGDDTANNGSFHGGTGWEWITHEFKLANTATNLIAGVQAPGGTTPSVSYLDRAIIIAGPVSPPEGAWDVQEGWSHIPPLDGASDGGRINLAAPPRDHEILRLVGRGLLSSVSADSDTIEIDGELLVPVYEKVRGMLAWEKAGGDVDSTWGRRAQEFDLAYRNAINSPDIANARASLVPNRRGPF
jgi:hypothetical protein